MDLAAQIQRVVNDGPGGGQAGPSLMGRTFTEHNGARWKVVAWAAEGTALRITVEPMQTAKVVHLANPAGVDRKMFGGVIG